MIGPAPSAEALAQYVEALGLGLDAETARSEIFPDHQPRVILSLVDVAHPLGPLVVGWDVCGACNRFVRACTCKAGPTPPLYVQAWRPADFEQPDAVSADVEPEPVVEPEPLEPTADTDPTARQAEEVMG